MKKQVFIFAFLSLALAFVEKAQGADNSLFLNPIDDVVQLSQLSPGDTGFDQNASLYLSRKQEFKDFLDLYTDPQTTVYSPPADLLTSKIRISEGQRLRMYFISEDAGYSNSLGYVTDNFDLNSPDNENSLLFPEIDTLINPFGPFDDVLRENDYVDMGTSQYSGALNFFVIQDGADAVPDDNITEPVFWSLTELNDDGVNHMKAVKFIYEDYEYYLLGFEDLNTLRNANVPGSLDPNQNLIDYTDVITVLAVEIPEPHTYLILSSFLLLPLVVKKRRQQTC